MIRNNPSRYLNYQCQDCGEMIRPVWFLETEYGRNGGPTGRKRRAVSHLQCDGCGKKEIVDDSFDGPWEVRHD